MNALTRVAGMKSLLDVNMLIAICDGHHIYHAQASEWFANHAAQGWATCPLIQNGVIRIMSQPSYPNSRPIGEVVKQVRTMCASKYHHFWANDFSIMDETKIAHQHVLGNKQLTDIYLLALAVQHSARLVTLDGGIALQAVKSAKKENFLQLL
jgi:toxin-antitoxin system PIN domain toxin